MDKYLENVKTMNSQELFNELIKNYDNMPEYVRKQLNYIIMMRPQTTKEMQKLDYELKLINDKKMKMKDDKSTPVHIEHVERLHTEEIHNTITASIHGQEGTNEQHGGGGEDLSVIPDDNLPDVVKGNVLEAEQHPRDNKCPVCKIELNEECLNELNKTINYVLGNQTELTEIEIKKCPLCKAHLSEWSQALLSNSIKEHTIQ